MARVFVSSTSRDLAVYRKVACDVILDLKWQPEMMEHFDAQPGATTDYCRKAIEQSDLVLLIVAHRQGWVPTREQGGNGEDSVTALELGNARGKNIDALILMADERWPGDFWENDDQAKRNWVRNFRAQVNQVAKMFEWEDPSADEAQRLPRFRALVRQTLVAHKERLLGRDSGGAPALDFFASARDRLRDGSGVPIVGCGIYGDGPLSSQALARELLRRDDGTLDQLSKEPVSLATAAEYRERLDLSRDPFLSRFREILRNQAAEAPVPSMLELLAGLAKTSLIVSTTYDHLLEERLVQRKYTVVAHILRSYDDALEGSVVIMRPDAKPEFTRSNNACFAPEERLLYKPLGSPFLHDALDPDLGIDTVVVTESDHATFLQRLQSTETGVPARIAQRFLRSPLLFLGYAMDVWQYRLMMLIFQSAKRQSNNASTLAVRVPQGEIEKAAWNRLNAQLVPMSPSDFARSASAAAASGG